MKIKSKLNGEVSNVRADIAREMVKLGVAELLEPDTGGSDPDGLGQTYSLPRPGAARPPLPVWSVDLVEVDNVQHVFWLAIRRELNWGQFKKNVDMCYLPPDKIRDHKFWKAVPEDVFQEYSRRWKQNENQRAKVLEPEKPNYNAQADKALIENAACAAGAAGILDGQQLVRRPGAGLFPERGQLKANSAANTTERVGGGVAPGEVIWGD